MELSVKITRTHYNVDSQNFTIFAIQSFFVQASTSLPRVRAPIFDANPTQRLLFMYSYFLVQKLVQFNSLTLVFMGVINSIAVCVV